MASSYSADLKLELMVTGENAGTWGDNTNENLKLVQQAIAGYEAVALTNGGTVALAMSDGALSNARNMVIKFTGTLTGASVVTIPNSIEKFYIFDLSAVGGITNLTIKTVSGTGFTPAEAKIVAAYSDGTNLNEIALDTLGGTIGTAQIADDAVTNAKIADDAIRAAQISNNAVVTAGILDANVTTAKIADDAVTTAKILNDNVTAGKLADTSVTAGSYTLASITVDAQGRLTAASTGTAGGANMILTRSEKGPNSGNHVAQPNATKVLAYCLGGGGPGGRGAYNSSGTGGNGGTGGGGAFLIPISQPSTTAYVVGGAAASTTFGNNATGGAGNAGQTVTPPGGPPGNAGNTSASTGNHLVVDYGPGNFGGNFVATLAGNIPSINGGGSGGGAQTTNPNFPGQPGQPGALIVYEDLGA